MAPDSISDAAIAERLVEALYEALLGRSADQAGLRQKTERLVAGEATIRELSMEIIHSSEFASRLPTMLAGRGRSDARLRLTNDVSQYGELWLLLRRWVNAQAHNGFVVDVGARGRERSNSYDLMYHFGWRGLLVEANPALLASIERDFADCDHTLVSCAVSDFTGRAVFTLGSNDDVSSLDRDLAGNWGSTRGEVEVDVRRLSDILAENAVPEVFDLLSLDIEGEDIKVLNDLVGTSAYRPEWVIIEASHDFRVKTLADAPFSKAVRDAYVVRDATCANLILGRYHPDRSAWTERREPSSGDGSR